MELVFVATHSLPLIAVEKISNTAHARQNDLKQVLSTAEACKNEFKTFRSVQPTRVVPSSLHQPLTDTTAQVSTNGGPVTAEGGKGNVETYKNMETELSPNENTTFAEKCCRLYHVEWSTGRCSNPLPSRRLDAKTEKKQRKQHDSLKIQ